MYTWNPQHNVRTIPHKSLWCDILRTLNFTNLPWKAPYYTFFIAKFKVDFYNTCTVQCICSIPNNSLWLDIFRTLTTLTHYLLKRSRYWTVVKIMTAFITSCRNLHNLFSQLWLQSFFFAENSTSDSDSVYSYFPFWFIRTLKYWEILWKKTMCFDLLCSSL